MSYGFRPKRRAQDAIAEIHYLASRSYEWVLEGDITACFDEISHVSWTRVRESRRQTGFGPGEGVPHIGHSQRGWPDDRDEDRYSQGGILSPLLSNIALSVLDEHFVGAWESHGNSTHANAVAARETPLPDLPVCG